MAAWGNYAYGRLSCYATQNHFEIVVLATYKFYLKRCRHSRIQLGFDVRALTESLKTYNCPSAGL